ncbi:MAG: hypothetical protein OEY66_12760 [Gammaproteobacteria bacterium]|nr:hypothetical protein [Gammaproteobacteria bacterium]
MDSSEQILKKVGIALLIVGVIDIGVMIYCITNKISYSSSFNIFAVIAGIFLMKGSIRTARAVTFFGAFMLAGFIGLLVIFPFMEPFELKAITFKLRPVSTVLSYVFMFVAIGFVYWVYKSLASEPVMTARKEAGLSHGVPKLAFALGGILVIGLSIAMYLLNNGSSAEIAKEKALEQFGDSYKYHITAMNFSGGHASARLTAYREGEIKDVHVEWNE